MRDTLPFFSCSELIEATKGKMLRGKSEGGCRGVSTDTRTLEPGNLFVALQGENFDGHDFLDKAAGRGAAGLMIRIDRQEKLRSTPETLPAIGVSNTLAAYGCIAAYWRRRFDIPVIAITGSSGKTTTKEMVAAILSRTMKTLKTEGNLNNQVGLPFTLLGLKSEHEAAILEMGTNSPGEILKLARIAKPDIGLITNIGPAHIEGLGSLEDIAREKGSLWTAKSGWGTAIINNDDTLLEPFADKWEGRRITFGMKNASDITARRIQTEGAEGIRFELCLGDETVPVFLAAVGNHNIKNALAAAATCLSLGLNLDQIAAGLTEFHPVSGRSEVVRLSNEIHLIMDTYNANPSSVTEALKTLTVLHGEKKAIAVLGDMLELGETAERWHDEIGSIVAESAIDFLFLKGPLTKFLARGATRNGFPNEKIVFFDNPSEVAVQLSRIVDHGDWILVKGSRKMKMEAVADAIIIALHPTKSPVKGF
jgi:UDP-N-acetylmuramoyl-tripeptide--D-alanyl-D-alanine ligase